MSVRYHYPHQHGSHSVNPESPDRRGGGGSLGGRENHHSAVKLSPRCRNRTRAAVDRVGTGACVPLGACPGTPRYDGTDVRPFSPVLSARPRCRRRTVDISSPSERTADRSYVITATDRPTDRQISFAVERPAPT